MSLKRKANIIKKDRTQNVQAIIVGANVWNLRKKMGLSQSELADLSGTTQRIISLIEDGTYNFGEDLIIRIANTLCVKTSILFKNINWIELEVIDIILKKAKLIGKEVIDILGLLKLYFFIDYNYKLEYGRLIQDRSYIRYKHGPYDNDLYKNLLNEENAIFYIINEDLDNIGHTYSEFSLRGDGMYNYNNLDDDDIYIIGTILDDYIIYDSVELKSISYTIPEMQAIGATIGGKEGLGTVILN